MIFGLILRLGLGLAGASAALLAHPAYQSLLLQASGIYAALSVFELLLDRRGLLGSRSRIALGLVDACFIALLLISVRQVSNAGAALVLPLAIAARHHKFSIASIAPILGGMVLASADISRSQFTNLDFAQAAIAILIAAAAGYQLPQRSKKSVENTERAPINPYAAALVQLPSESPEAAEPATDELQELRASYRKLREAMLDQDERSKRDRLASKLMDVAITGQETDFAKLAAFLREMTGARGLTLYTCADDADSLIVRAASGDVPYRVSTERISLDMNGSDVRLRAHALRELKDDEDDSPAAVTLIKHGGKLVGMVWQSADRKDQMDTARDRADESADLIGKWIQLIQDAIHREDQLRRVTTLYRVAGITAGAADLRSVSERTLSDLWPGIGLDHAAIHVLSGGELAAVSERGATLRLLDVLEFDGKSGVSAWVAGGALPIHISDTHNSPLCQATEAIKRRVGSFFAAAFPLANGETAIFTGASHRKGGVTQEHAETLRLTAGELGHWARRETAESPMGVVTMPELQRGMNQTGGALIQVEALRAEDIQKEHGAEPLAEALRNLARRLRTQLDPKAMICCRESDLVIFIPQMDLDSARKWANEASAIAALAGIVIGKGKGGIRLAVRARASSIGAQSPKDDRENAGSSHTLAGLQ